MWDGLGMMDLLSKQSLMENGTAALGGAGGIMIGAQVLPMIPWVKDDPKYKALAAVVLGAVGGSMIHKFINREAALGFVGGMAGMGIASLASQFTGTKVSLDDIGEEDADDDYEMDEELESPVVSSEQLSYIGQPEDENLLGMGDANVSEEMLAGFDQAVVSTQDELGSWLT
jgi:hypothetical protein